MGIFKVVEGQGEDVVLLHGGCDDHRYMQPIMEQLSDRYRVTSLDEPGRGKSEWQPQIKNIHDMADALLPALPENAIYIGWSFGGLIATSIAARYPERVKRIINISSVPKFTESINWPGLPPPGFGGILSIIAEQGLTSFLKMFHDGEFENFDPKPNEYHKLNHILENIKADIAVINKRINICDVTDLRQELSLLKFPIDFIFGEKDGAISLALHEKVKELNSNIHIHVISNAQHMAMWTHPTEFKTTLEKILIR